MSILDIRTMEEITKIKFSDQDIIENTPDAGVVVWVDTEREESMLVDLDNLDNLKAALDKAKELWGGE